MSQVWQESLALLKDELNEMQFNTWISPLRVREEADTLRLLVPNATFYDWIQRKLLDKIRAVGQRVRPMEVVIEVGDYTEPTLQPGGKAAGESGASVTQPNVSASQTSVRPARAETAVRSERNRLNPAFTFDSFVEGKSNQLAVAAARQVAENPGVSYNPFFIYGGVGLGKTHLMQAVGNAILERDPNARVVYIHSETFAQNMVNALRHNTMERFKRYYRSLDALLIDDIQFFVGKEHSQEEFFHTFNTLLEGNKQIILTSDKFPKEVDGLEERLKSRFGWGLTIQIEPPDFEMRVAILLKKASEQGIHLPEEVAFFIAKLIRGNVRELEGALKRVSAHAQFAQAPITVTLAKEALRDMVALQQRMVTLENIQKTVADYYKVRVSDLLSKKRSRNIAQPRQMAMALAKELTSHSLPEIGDAFGGRDHTTVLHAVRKIKKLRQENPRFEEDFSTLMKIMTN